MHVYSLRFGHMFYVVEYILCIYCISLVYNYSIISLSLSTVVLNSRDWWEIVWLLESFTL